MRTLLIGTEKSATELIHDIRAHEPQITWMGIIYPTPTRSASPHSEQPATLADVPICGPITEISYWIKKEKIDLVIIALLQVEREIFEILLEQVPPGTVTWKIIPQLFHQPNLKLTYKHLLPLSAADLIGHRDMAIDIPYLTETFRDQTVLVTGAGGSIGSELVRGLLYYPVKRVLALARSEYSLCTLIELIETEHSKERIDENLRTFIANIKDIARLREIAEVFSIDIIMHAAAHKHVPLMENNEKEAIKNNVLATHNLLKLTKEKAIRSFVFVSTDKAVAPKSVMGASKKLAEQLIRKYTDLFPFEASIVRLGNVIGSRGSVIPLFNKQIRSGGPVTVTDPKTNRYFMTMAEAALLIITIGAFTLKRAKSIIPLSSQPAPHASHPSKTYILNMGASVRIDTLIRRIIRLQGLIPDQDIQISYIGMRPGEKLDEVLYQKNSKMIKTHNPNISEIIEQPEDLALSWKHIQELEKTIHTCSATDVRRVLKTLNILHTD